MSKCLGKDRNNNPCRSNAQDGTQFCKNHQYMVDYTPEMLSALQLCKGCMKMYFFEGDTKQCAKLQRKRQRKPRESKIKCGFVQIRRLQIQTFCGEYLLRSSPTLFICRRVHGGRCATLCKILEGMQNQTWCRLCQQKLPRVFAERARKG